MFFTHRAGVAGQKIYPSGTGAILATPPLPPRGRGGRETFEISPGGFVVLFLFLLASEEQVPKQSKQVSIVGIN